MFVVVVGDESQVRSVGLPAERERFRGGAMLSGFHTSTRRPPTRRCVAIRRPARRISTVTPLTLRRISTICPNAHGGTE